VCRALDPVVFWGHLMSPGKARLRCPIVMGRRLRLDPIFKYTKLTQNNAPYNQGEKIKGGNIMPSKSVQISGFVFLASLALLAGCSKEAKDDVMGQIITDCQLSAHSAMETSNIADEKRHSALGAFVEKCLKESGLQPSDVSKSDSSCFEAPTSAEDGKGFIKPLQKCWKNTRASKG